MNQQIVIAGKTIFYRVYGKGEPVMLVHGFGETGEVWNNQVRPSQTPPKEKPPQTPPKEGLQTPIDGDFSLLDRFKFIIPDLPGSGKSEMIDDMSVEGMAEILKLILDKETEALDSTESKVSPSGRFRGANKISPPC